MPPEGLEQPTNSSGNAGVHSESGAESGALYGKTTTGTADTGHQEESEGTAAADQGDPLTKLAAALLTLSPADRERLTAMLTGLQNEGEGKAALPPSLGSFPTDKPNQGPQEQ
ncbi:MAG: hypothetical protein WCJ35_25495 [Planctomycetota bacterium]